MYMRSSSAANSAASSPPAPARISTMTFRSSLGSRGRSETLRSSTSWVSRVSSSAISSRARSLHLVVGLRVPHLPRARELGADVAELPVGGDDRLQARELAAQRAELVGVGMDLGRGQLRGHLVVLAGEGLELGVEA